MVCDVLEAMVCDDGGDDGDDGRDDSNDRCYNKLHHIQVWYHKAMLSKKNIPLNILNI
jgi:hypothetical protein